MITNSETSSRDQCIGRLRVGYPVVDSTMRIASELARRGAPHGTVVQAEMQTAGSGRQGREWIAAHGTALLTSWILRFPSHVADGGALSPLVALATIRAIRSIAPDAPVSLKWPNDVLVDGRKVGGILLASRISAQENVTIAGVGVNILPGAVPDGIDAAVLSEWTPGLTVDLLLDALAVSLESVVQSFAMTGRMSNDECDEMNAMLAWRGQPVRLLAPAGDLTGLACGIDADGSLQFCPNGESQAVPIRMGEVVRGPRPIG